MNSSTHIPKSVLIIDDDATLRATVEADLEDAGFIVRQAVDGPSGLIAFETQLPDLVLLDVTMQGMDGFAVCEAIRAMPAGAFTPVMMLTGHDDCSSVERALSVGANDFAVKPINDAVLVHRVRFLLRAAETAAQLRRERADLQKAQKLAKMGSWELHPKTEGFQHSPELARVVAGDPSTSLTIHQIWEAVRSDDQTIVLDVYKSAVQEERPNYEIEFRLERPRGEQCFVHQYVEIEFDESGRPERVFGTLQDITERREAEARIKSLAFFDSTTGLPNRNMFLSHLERAIATCNRNGKPLSILMFQVGQLGRINKAWGHAIGDKVLQILTSRSKAALCTKDIREIVGNEYGNLARFSGEVFAIMLQDLRKPEDAARVAQRLLDAMSVPVNIEDSEIVLEAHAGICLYPTNGSDAQEIVKHCSVALDTAKPAGRGKYAFYDENDSTQALARLSLEGHLRSALEREEFELHYQPKVSIDGYVVGMEALLRWRSINGMISPAEFIPIAEETGVIRPLGAWVLATACEQTQRWHENGWSDLRISVNLSAIQLEDEGLVDIVADALARTGLDPEALELELTESMLMSNVERNVLTLRALRKLGIQLSIDDFGTGFSSLQYLKNLPVTALKIDRCFIQEIDTSYEDLAIVRGTIALAHSLGLHVVAEGVEHEAQKEKLFLHGCDLIQGYLYSRPCPADEFIAWVEANDPRGYQPGALKSQRAA